MLIVDDSALALAAVRAELRPSGVATVTATSVAEALRVIEAPIDGAILDIDLPDGSGVDVATVLAATLPGCRIAFFSASADHPTRARALRFGPIFDKRGGLPQAVRYVLERGAAPAMKST